ncbi:MAG: hypothetical protein AAFX85_06750, partial [Pseudomonadota bacterium]
VDFLWLRATILTMFGRLEESLAQIEQAIPYGGTMTPSMLRVEPVWKPLLGLEGFTSLLDESGRRWRYVTTLNELAPRN